MLLEHALYVYVAFTTALLCWSHSAVSCGELPKRPDSNHKISREGSLSRCRSAYGDMDQEKLSRLIDASGKPGSGIYEGNTVWFGSFSQCKKQPNSRYCLINFDGVITLMENKSQVESFYWGACIPDVCSKEDLAGCLEFFLNNISKVPVKPVKNEKNVACAENSEYTAGAVLTIVFCGVLLLICTLATFLEILSDVQQVKSEESVIDDANNFRMMKKPDGDKALEVGEDSLVSKIENLKGDYVYEIINCFSFIRNITFIMSTKAGNDDLKYLHGIRVLSMFWMIFSHVGPLFLDTPITENVNDVLNFMQRRPSMILFGGQLAVDTFLVLSGLLVVYVTLRKREKNQDKTNWFRFYLHRLWRFIPSYMFLIFFYSNLRPLFGDGPLWFMARDTSNCFHYWWTNLLFINNFFPLDKTCITPTWYIALDMQFFIISPLFIIIGLRFGFRAFAAVSGVVIMGGVLTTAISIGVKDHDVVRVMTYRGMPLEERQRIMDYGSTSYRAPYCRIQPYILGMVLGFFIVKFMSREFRLRWYKVISLWIIAIAVQVALLYAPSSAYKEDPHVWSKGEIVLFGSLRRTIWGLTFVWVIFACQYGYAGPIKSFLAAKFWIPLSRINYGAYIAHMDLVFIIIFNIEKPLHHTGLTQFTYFSAALVLSYICALVLTLTVELPCSNLESLAWKKASKALEKKTA